MSMEHVPFDPDFDEPARRPAATVVESQHGQSVFDALSGSTAFALGIVTAFLALASIGFFVLLTLFFV